MAALHEVKDKKYTNWLSVNLALHYMKSGVHAFIKREFDCLHQSLVQKIYGGPTVSLPPCTICHACRVKRDENGVWAFKKRCRSDCAVWLEELLAHHANPKSEEIYWNNSNVPTWPFQPWECAKVYMPRGQQISNSGPAECDAQSLLMLLDKCTHFHPKLSPKGLSLTQTISAVRNKIMHDGEMKLSDADRMNFIQHIIQLLEDPIYLKSLDDCKAAVSNIHKIDNDSLDADLEMTALRTVVNEFRLELGIQEKRTLDTVDSLKEEYKQLREHIKKRFEDDATKKLPIQEHVQSVKSQINTLVQQEKKHQDMPTTVITHEVKCSTDMEGLGTESQECESGILTQTGNNTNRKRKAVGKGIAESGIPEKLHRSVLNRCLPELVRNLDFKAVSMYIQQKEILDDVTMEDIMDDGAAPSVKKRRLIQWIQQRDPDTYEKFKECLVLAKQGDLKDMLEEEEERVAINKDIETAPNRRPESDGLKQLKSQTENKLGTVKKLGYIPTTQAAEAEKLLEEKRSVIIKGNPGEGKTTIALHLIDNEMYRDRRVVVYSPRDWKTVDTDWVEIVVLEDILGKYDLDPSCLQEWMVYLPTIQEHVDAGKLQVIITTRVDILAKADSKLGSHKLFSDHLSLTLSSQNLNKSEKMRILNRELQRSNRNMKEDEIEKCITNFSGLIGFPQSCLLFAADSKLFKKGPEFFKSPNELFFENICNLNAEMFISLAFLFCHGKIYEEHLSPEAMLKSSNDLFMELASHLHISKKKADITLLRNAYEIWEGLYIEKSISNDIISGVLVTKTCFRFSHATVCEAVGRVLAKYSLEMVVKHGDPEYLYQRTYTAEAMDKTSENVFLPVSMYSSLAERMVHDVVEKTLVKSAAKHSVLKQNEFLKKLKDVLHKGNRIKDFFMANSYFEFRFMEFLMTESRLFCQDLSEGECSTFLQYVLQSDDGTVKLVYSHFMEFFVCTHNNNNSDCWQCNEKQNVLELALYYHSFEIADKLITMNAYYTHVSLCNAAKHGDLSRVQTVLEDLKRNQVFNPDCTEAKKALCRAYLSRSQDVIEILLQVGITLDSMHLEHAVQHGDIDVLKKVVEHLKFHNKWHQLWAYDSKSGSFYKSDINSGQIASIPLVPNELGGSTALYIAYCNEKLDMADYLLQNEAKVTMDMLAAVTEHNSKEAVDRVIQHLKVTRIWDPHCDDASQALGKAFGEQKYDICDTLVQEGVVMTVKNLHCVVGRSNIPLNAVKKVVKYLKDTENWDPNCDDASKALEEAFARKNHNVCDLLIHEGVAITMKHVPHVILRSLDYVKTVIKQLKDTDSWDPKCDDASKALAKAFERKKYDVCDLLIQEGVSLTMKNILHVVGVFEISLKVVKKAVQHLKDTNNWDPKCRDVSDALDFACIFNNDVRDLLIHEGVSLTMKHVFHAVLRSLDYVKTVVKQLKDTDSWDSKCDDASQALAIAYRGKKYDVCDLLIQEGVSLTMKNLLHVIGVFEISLEAVKKAVQHLKDTKNWDPNCEDASNALGKCLGRKKFDVCDLLIQEGVSLTMKNLPHVVGGSEMALEVIRNAVQHLKHTNNWDPNCEDVSKAILEEAFRRKKYDVCDLLIQEGVSLTMKNFLHVVGGFDISLYAVKKAVQHLKDTNNWDPNCEDVSEALEEAYGGKKYDVCDLLIQEGVSLTMKNFPHVILRSLDFVKKVVNELKDSDSWNPMYDDASKALEEAYIQQKYDVCDLLSQEGVSLTMKNLLHVVKRSGTTLEVIKKIVQYLKNTHIWDPKCENLSLALKMAHILHKYDVYDLLIQEGVSITMKHVPHVVLRSLDFVKTIVKQLKDTDSWNSKCDDASEALTEAFRRKKYDVSDLLIQEGVSLTMKNLPHVVSGTEISLNAVKKTVQHLKDTENWDPNSEDMSEALKQAYGRKKYDVCDMLIQEGVSITMKLVPRVILRSLGYVKTVVKQLKDTDSWDPKCDDASNALANAYIEKKYDVCNLLIQEGVSLTREDLLLMVMKTKISLYAVKKAVQHLKDNNNWDPKCKDMSYALEMAYMFHNYEVCDLLNQEGVSITMKHVPHVVLRSLDYVKTAVKQLKDTDSWDPKCFDASQALENAYIDMKYDVFDLLIQEGVAITMNHVPHALSRSLDYVKTVVKQLKDTDSWDPKCYNASYALTEAFRTKKYDVCDLLIQEGVSLTMNNLPGVVSRFQISLETVKKTVQHLKYNSNWDPTCRAASDTLEKTFKSKKYDVCNLLIQEGVSLTMENLHCLVAESEISLEVVMKAVQHLNYTNNWDPNCKDALNALEEAYKGKNYDVCNLLIQEGVSLTMNNLPGVVGDFLMSLETVKKAVQHLKDTNNWDPKCKDASKALEEAYGGEKYDVCDLLIEEGVSLRMKNLAHIFGKFSITLEVARKIVQHLKDTHIWDPKCKNASKALEEAYEKNECVITSEMRVLEGDNYEVCDMLVQEGVSLTMKNLTNMVRGFRMPLGVVKKVVQHLKDIQIWDPKCKDASKALEEAYRKHMYVCDLLIQEGVSLTMKNLPHVVGDLDKLEYVKKAVQHLKDTNSWDPKCEGASEALEEAYGGKKYDVCDLLIQEGVSITMKCIPHVILRSLDYVKTVVNQLKDSDSWDPKCDKASNALEEAYIQQKYDVCDQLVQEGVSLTMRNLPHMVAGFEVSVETVKKAVQHLKNTCNWDPKCNDASKALEDACGEQRYEVCDLLIQEGVSLTMKNIPGVVYRVSLEHVKKAIQHLGKYYVCDLLIQDQVSLIINVVRTFQVPLKTVKKAIEHLKENENWDAKSDEASEALANAYSAQIYDVCDMLLEETVSLSMIHFPGVVGGFEVSCNAVIKAMQHLKATDMWDPKSEYASKALANAYKKQKYNVCDLLIQEGVSLTMQTFDGVVEGFQVSLEAVKKALQHLKDTDNWAPSCEHASKALENAYVIQKYDVCDLLIQEGVSLLMKNIPGVVYSVSLKYVKKVIQHMNTYDVFDLLVLKRASPTLKNLPYVVGRSRVSLKAVRKVIQHLKETKNWDSKSDYASIALANAYGAQIYDVCDLLAQEGVLPDNEESSSNGAAISGIIGSS